VAVRGYVLDEGLFRVTRDDRWAHVSAHLPPVYPVRIA